MKITHISTRILAFLLILCTLVGLLPGVAVLEAKAEPKPDTRDISSDITDLIGKLNTLYTNIQIPINNRRDITASNKSSLDGVYFILGGTSTSGYRVLNPHASLVNKTLRITKNTTSNPVRNPATGDTLPTLAATYAYPSITKINGNVIRDLNQCIEISKYTGTVIKDTTTPHDVGTGWQDYLDWEWGRNNDWSGNTFFRDYLGIKAKPTAGKATAYTFKSLSPNRSSYPYIGNNAKADTLRNTVKEGHGNDGDIGRNGFDKIIIIKPNFFDSASHQKAYQDQCRRGRKGRNGDK